MQSKLNPYIHFVDNAREAMEFYKNVFGGELVLNTFGDSGMTDIGADANGVMHAQLTAENGMTLMASDTPPKYREQITGKNISISLSGDNEEELTGYYNKLIEGGKVSEPLTKAPWGDMFGMLTDKFGIDWMVNIAGQKSE